MPSSSRGPYAQRRTSTRFLRVAGVDFIPVTRGLKREYRSGHGKGRQSMLFNASTPTPVVVYTIRPGGRYQHALMVLEAVRVEMLGAITEQSLRREGCATIDEFRRYWMAREHRRFTPTRKVLVHELRPWRAGDEEELGYALLEHLYREFLPEAA